MTYTHNSPIEQLNTYLQKHHLRKTFEREQILLYIHQIDGHFTAQSLYNETYDKYHISRASIYNILDLFLNAGLIIRHPFICSEAQYETTQRAATHHHRICISCGAIKEFTDQKYTKAIKSRSFAAFEPQFHSIYLYGLCKKCQQKENIKNKVVKK